MTLQLPAHEDGLSSLCARMAATVPGCVGLTVVAAEHDLTVTLVSSDDDVAVLDGVQYLDGGPTARALARGEPVRCDTADAGADGPWTTFARTCAGAGVRSALALPVAGAEGQVAGAINLYAAGESDMPDDELTALLDGWVPEAMRDAEHAFAERAATEHRPRSLRGEGAVNRAMGQLGVHLDIDMTAAHARLEDAATRAGVPVERLAAALVQLPV